LDSRPSAKTRAAAPSKRNSRFREKAPVGAEMPGDRAVASGKAGASQEEQEGQDAPDWPEDA
jgi:hypothetical protein